MENKAAVSYLQQIKQRGGDAFRTETLLKMVKPHLKPDDYWTIKMAVDEYQKRRRTIDFYNACDKLISKYRGDNPEPTFKRSLL